MEKNEKTKSSKKWLWVVFGAIVLLILVSCLGGKQDETAKTADSQEAEKTVAEDVKKAIENECIDAKYGINKDFNPISITNYNFDIYDYAYTDKGDMIYLATWNGKDKKTDNQVVFQCYASKSGDGAITVYYIQAGGKDIWKGQSDVDYNSYNKDGTPMSPELH